MATMVTVAVLVASGGVSAACACAAYAFHRWRASQSETPTSTGSTGILRTRTNGGRFTRGLFSGRANNGGVASNASPSPYRRTLPPHIRRITPGHECVVCRDELLSFPKKTPTKACSHQVEVCFDCLRKTIKAAVSAGNTGSNDKEVVKCPTVDCGRWLSRTDVKAWADKETFETYDKMSKGWEPLNKQTSRCLSSTCKGKLRKAKGTNNLAVCVRCGAKQCYVHQSPWHENYTCKQWDKKRAATERRNDQLSNDWINTWTKPCPGPRCGKRIWKQDGCDHITCRKPAGCGHQFCWLCMAPWDPIRRYDNSKHYDNCKYYSGKPGGHPAPIPNVPQRRWWQLWKKSQ